MTQLELADFESSGTDTPPYPIPFPEGTDANIARSHHRTWYWTVHDEEIYQCPDCDRGLADIDRFEVHHIDQNPLNGDPDNLVALCKRCHYWRHSEEKSLSLLSPEEWRDEFMNITESEFLQ